MNVNREMLAFLRDPYAPVEAGMTGKLDYIDDAGQFHMKWDNGRALALIPGVDSFTVLPPELSMTKQYRWPARRCLNAERISHWAAV